MTSISLKSFTWKQASIKAVGFALSLKFHRLIKYIPHKYNHQQGWDTQGGVGRGSGVLYNSKCPYSFGNKNNSFSFKKKKLKMWILDMSKKCRVDRFCRKHFEVTFRLPCILKQSLVLLHFGVCDVPCPPPTLSKGSNNLSARIFTYVNHDILKIVGYRNDMINVSSLRSKGQGSGHRVTDKLSYKLTTSVEFRN